MQKLQSQESLNISSLTPKEPPKGRTSATTTRSQQDAPTNKPPLVAPTIISPPHTRQGSRVKRDEIISSNKGAYSLRSNPKRKRQSFGEGYRGSFSGTKRCK